MTAPVAGGGAVDVLSIMQAACCVFAADRTADPQRQLEQAFEVVAELIAADMEFDEAEADLASAIKSYGARSVTAGRCRTRVRAARKRRAAALSNIEGAST